MRLALFAFIGALLAGPAAASVCSTLPYTLTNGQTADATQVMANFNALLACLNNNVALAGNNTNITALLGLTTPLSQAQGGTGGTSAVNSLNGRSGSVTLTGADINTALGYTPPNPGAASSWSGLPTFGAGLQAQTLAGPNFGVRVLGEAGGPGIIQFTDITATTEWGKITVTSSSLDITSDAGPVTIGGHAPLLANNNLSDLTSAPAARTNLGLGNSATENVGTGPGTVAAGNDARFTGTASAWANFSCTTGGCTLSPGAVGVSSVTRIAAGEYQVNFSSTHADTVYTINCSVETISPQYCYPASGANKTTSGFVVFDTSGADGFTLNIVSFGN